MAKKHISFWIEEKDLKECESNIKISDCKNRSEYIAQAVKFYNGYLHDKNNEEYINRKLMDSLEKMMEKFENRTARLMFKQAVENAKIFWLLVKEFEVNLHDVDTLHESCVDEVKKINGAIQYPLLKGKE